MERFFFFFCACVSFMYVKIRCVCSSARIVLVVEDGVPGSSASAARRTSIRFLFCYQLAGKVMNGTAPLQEASS